MSGFFLGPPARQLFGYHHVPRGAPERAVLICPSWAYEYQYAHRALNFLGRRLAAGGAHVLRFDYSGTGDSWGGTEEVDLEQWRDDVVQAAAELRTMSGMDRIDVVGLRLGAVLGARASAGIGRVHRLVLWDPVVRGSAWVRELGSRPAGVPGDYLEVGGLLANPALVRQLEEVGPDAYGEIAADRVFLLLTQADDTDGVGGELLCDLSGIEVDRIEQAAPWVEDRSIWTGEVPVEAVRRVTEWLK